MKRHKWTGILVLAMLAFNAHAALDLSGNGISDVYERRYGLTGLESAGSDLDGDGWTLAQEYLLGTDPTVFDPSPVLLNKLTLSATNGQVAYSFMANAGLRYRVEYTNVLTSASSGWRASAEILGAGTVYSFMDSATNAMRYYRLVAVGPAADADRDGLDSREEALLGANPNAADSDGDGLPDGYEAVTAGCDPAVAGGDGLASLEYRETFESFTNNLLNGQNGWRASSDKQALVQAGTPYSGLKGLQLAAFKQGVVVEKYFNGAALSAVSNIWIDFYLLPGATADNPAPPTVGPLDTTKVYFNTNGHLKAFNGTSGQWVTDTFAGGVGAIEWRRLTFCLNYTTQQWLVYLNGNLVNPAPGGVPTWFGFSSPSPFFFRLAFEAQGNGNELYLDDLAVSTRLPLGLNITP